MRSLPLRFWSAIVLTGLSVLPHGEVAAQQCLGGVSFGTAPVQIGASVTVHDALNRYEATVRGGGTVGFVGASVGLGDYSFSRERLPVFGFLAGRSFDLVNSGALSLCPIATLGYRRGPTGGAALSSGGAITRITSSVSSAGIGAALGARIAAGPTSSLVPFVSAELLWDRLAFSGAGFAAARSSRYGMLSVGVSLALDDRVVLRPALNTPVGTDREESSFSVAASVAVGRKR